jgi:hypothetical protein
MNVEITIWGVTCVIARLNKMQFELFKLVCWCFVSCRMLLSPHCWKSPGIFWLRSGTLGGRFNQFIVVFISRERRIFAFIRRERIVRLMTLSHVSRDVWPELPALPGNQFRLEVSASQHCFNQMWRRQHPAECDFELEELVVLSLQKIWNHVCFRLACLRAIINWLRWQWHEQAADDLLVNRLFLA